MLGQGTRIRKPSRFHSVHGGAGRLVVGDTETEEEEDDEKDEKEEEEDKEEDEEEEEEEEEEG